MDHAAGKKGETRIPCPVGAQLHCISTCQKIPVFPVGSMILHAVPGLLEGLYLFHVDLSRNVFVHSNRCLTELDHIRWPSLVQFNQTAGHQSHGGQPVQAGMGARRYKDYLCLFAGRQVGKRHNERFHLLTKHGTAFTSRDGLPIG